LWHIGVNGEGVSTLDRIYAMKRHHEHGRIKIATETTQNTLGKWTWTAPKQYRFTGFLALAVLAWFFPHSFHTQEAKTSTPNLNLILDSLERTEQQNSALSRPYEVTREYKVFRDADPSALSEVSAEVSFTPPGIKTFKIIEAHGNPRGEKIVRALLEQEIESAKEGHRRRILGLFLSMYCISYLNVRREACSLGTSG